MKDLLKMMKQAQDIQGRMQKMQEELAAMAVEGQSGAGMVKVKLGPISTSFKGQAHFVERDDAGHKAVLKAESMETIDMDAAAFTRNLEAAYRAMWRDRRADI